MNDQAGTASAANAPFEARTVADVLACWPEAAPAFTRLRMACVGCPMAAFETLDEAARAYGLDPDAVYAAVKRAVASRPPGR